MTKRYTIEFSITEIDDDGELIDGEVAGVTMDWATTDLETLESIMSQCYEDADAQLWDWSPDPDNTISARRPDENGYPEGWTP